LEDLMRPAYMEATHGTHVGKELQSHDLQERLNVSYNLRPRPNVEARSNARRQRRAFALTAV